MSRSSCRDEARQRSSLATSLWRRELIDVWYQQVRGMEPSLRGPFYSLTISGQKLASSFFD